MNRQELSQTTSAEVVTEAPEGRPMALSVDSSDLQDAKRILDELSDLLRAHPGWQRIEGLPQGVVVPTSFFDTASTGCLNAAAFGASGLRVDLKATQELREFVAALATCHAE